MRQAQVLQQLKEKQFVKVISGIDNFDIDKVSQVVRAATVAVANAVDVAARQDIVKLARQTTHLPVFASSITPQDLALAVANGADVAEIGNFDSLYKDGHFLTYSDVLSLTEQTLALIPKNALICVTIPGFLPMEAQIRLAQAVEELGVAMIQTEGIHKEITANNRVLNTMTAEEKALASFKCTAELVQAVNIPVMTASGISSSNAAIAFENGASAIGVGSAVNRLMLENEMIEEVLRIVRSVKNQTVVMPAEHLLTQSSKTLVMV